MDQKAVLFDLRNSLPGSRVATGVPLSSLSSWKIGGEADILISPESIEDVAFVKRYAYLNDIPVIVVGGGSNILFDDNGFRGIVLHIGRGLTKFSINKNGLVHVEAGHWTPAFVHKVARAGYSGCTHAIGIPGSIGGLVVMNGGTRRKGIGENLVEATVVNDKGEIIQLSQTECQFGYRSSLLQNMGGVVVEAAFQYAQADKRALRQEMLGTLRDRNKKFPRKLPNCGSVFLSDPELYATVGPPGKAIEEAGLKGTRRGAAEVSTMHANFIINRGGATSADILSLISHIRYAVNSRTGHWLECEVRHLLPDGRMQAAHVSAEQFFPHE